MDKLKKLLKEVYKDFDNAAIDKKVPEAIMLIKLGKLLGMIMALDAFEKEIKEAWEVIPSLDKIKKRVNIK